ncbi:MAG TPA: hypothetical protein VMT46_11370 [Anaerolineaceae bacterium]|nr:hypothetical protein [Anaerolineaceae bacterium]
MVSTQTRPEIGTAAWAALYRAGGAAALLAGLIFRRNLGAEVSLFFHGGAQPATVAEWYALFQRSPLTGLAYLDFFDLVDYLLVGLAFLALGAALWKTSRSAVAVALACGGVGIAANIAGNTSFAMLSLSQRAAAAASEAQRAMLLAAGQAVLALNDPQSIFQGMGDTAGYLLLATAALIFSLLMLRGQSFSRWAAILGILSSACDLAYCATFAFAPFLRAYLLSAGGLFVTIWHILVGLRLLRLSRSRGVEP